MVLPGSLGVLVILVLKQARFKPSYTCLHLQNHCTYYFSDPRHRLSELPVLAELLK
jgi:hypothetical protein